MLGLRNTSTVATGNNTFLGFVNNGPTINGANWAIGSRRDATSEYFTIANSTGGAYNYRVNILSNGFFGINTATPAQRLDVVGNVQFSGALMPNGQNGGAGQVLTSAGANNPPTWANASALPVTVSNTSNANTLTTIVNGVTATGVNIINSNALTLSSNNLVSTVNGVSSSVAVPNIYNADGTIAASTNRQVTLGDRQTSKLTIAPAGEFANISTLNVIGGATTGGISTGITVSSNYTNNTDKWGVIKVPQYVNANPAVQAITMQNLAGSNILYVGGTNSNSQASPSVIRFRVDGDNDLTNTSASSFVEGMTILGVTGNVGIGNINPGQRLDVTGNVQFSGALMPNGDAGAAGKVLTSAGTGAAPTWTAIAAPEILVVANRITSSYTISTTYATLIYNSTSTNVGTAYNTTNGEFTAPADGIYHIIFNNTYRYTNYNNNTMYNRVVLSPGSGDIVDTEVANGSWPESGGSSAGIITVNGTTIVNLTSGQKVVIQQKEGRAGSDPAALFAAGQHKLTIVRIK